MPKTHATAKLPNRAESTPGVRGRKRFTDVDRILDAARACFEKYGVERTRLGDVAIAAGISRPLLYQFFSDRRALMDAVILKEIREIVKIQSARKLRLATFAETVIEISLIGIKLARQNRVLFDLYAHSSVKHLPALLLDPKQSTHEVVYGLWKPVFDKARESGELRRNVDDHDLIEWLLSVNYMFLLRDDITPRRQKELLSLFVVPALESPGRLAKN